MTSDWSRRSSFWPGLVCVSAELLPGTGAISIPAGRCPGRCLAIPCRAVGNYVAGSAGFRIRSSDFAQAPGSNLAAFGYPACYRSGSTSFADELAAVFRGAFGKIEDQIELGYLESRAQGFFVPSDKIMERLVRGARHDAVETLLARIADVLSGEARRKLEASLADPKRATGFLSLKADAGAATLENILAATALGIRERARLAVPDHGRCRSRPGPAPVPPRRW